jgi:hypothetical protein
MPVDGETAREALFSQRFSGGTLQIMLTDSKAVDWPNETDNLFKGTVRTGIDLTETVLKKKAV